MAKTTGPLLSFGASGTIAKTAVFSKWKGIPYVRQHVVPSNPNTSAQQLTRNVFKFLSDMWKGAPTLLRTPWDRFATGQPLTGRNAWIGKNTAALRSEILMTDVIGSPGAKGGLAAASMTATDGTGQVISVAYVMPATPTGWTLTAGVGVSFVNDDPQSNTDVTIVAVTDDGASSPMSINVGAADDYTVAFWPVWTKPDGSLAYGPGINDDVTIA